MASRGLARKAEELGPGKRCLIVDHERCKPNTPAFTYLSRLVRNCGKECITVVKTPGKPDEIRILEEACLACLNRAKHAPGEAVHIINLPSNLTADTTHRYGHNAFKLHGLPTPRPGSVLGLLGTNGIGKSTALKVLSGQLKPNLGELDPEFVPGWSAILAYFRGSELQAYFLRLLEDEMKIAHKAQLDGDFVKHLKGRKVRDVLLAKDEGRGRWELLIIITELLIIIRCATSCSPRTRGAAGGSFGDYTEIIRRLYGRGARQVGAYGGETGPAPPSRPRGACALLNRGRERVRVRTPPS